MGKVTLVAVADLVPLYGRPLPTLRQWPARFGIEPVAYVSDTAVFRINHVIKRMRASSLRLEPDPAVVEEIRARATIEVPAVICGMNEVAFLLDQDRVLVHNWYRRGEMPTPAAILRPAFKPDGEPAQRLAVWTAPQFAMYPGYSGTRAQQLAETHSIG